MATPHLRKASDNAIDAALRASDGQVAQAARLLGMARQSLHERVTASPRLRGVIQEIEDEILDLGIGHITKGVKDGDKDYVKMFVTQKGRKRGWGNKVDVGIDDAQAEAIVAALGGDVAAYRETLAQLGIPATEIP